MKRYIIPLSIVLASILVSGSIIFTNIFPDKEQAPVTAISSNIENPEQINTKEESGVSFEVSKFELIYNEDPDNDGILYEKSYRGTGFIMASGDSKLVQEPYYLFLKIKRVKGGEQDGYTKNEQICTIVVTNGSGTFSTTDSIWRKTDKLERPEYEFEIIGYIPITEQQIID